MKVETSLPPQLPKSPTIFEYVDPKTKALNNNIDFEALLDANRAIIKSPEDDILNQSPPESEPADPEEFVFELGEKMVIKQIMKEEEKDYDGNGLLKQIGYDPNQRIWDPDFFFGEAQRMFKMALSNQLEEVLLECDLNMFKSYFYPMAKGGIIALLAVSSLDRELIYQGIDAFKIAAEMAYHLKIKKSWKNVLFKPDYNKFTDEEIMSEIVYSGAVSAIGGLTLLTDKSYRGLLTAAVHFNKSWKLYFEANNISKYRKKWQHPLCKKQFDMGLKLSMAISKMVFSFAPDKVKKFMNMFGLSGDLEKGLEEIHEVADSQDAFIFIPAAMALLLWYGLIEPVNGVGESRRDIICHLAENFVQCDLYGNLNYFVLGARELVLGNLDSSIAYENKTRDALSYLGNTTVVTSVFNLLNYSLSGQIDKAVECLELFDRMKVKAYLPSFLIYIHAAAQRFQLDEDIEAGGSRAQELEESITSKLKQIKTTRGFFVLKKVFYEKMIEERSRMFAHDVKNWLIPYVEILYTGNFFYVIEGNWTYIKPFLDKVTKNLEGIEKNDPNYWDKYAYLLFYKAFLLKLGGEMDEALAYFHEILSLESIIEREKHIIPQICYEIGLIHRKRKKEAEAKRWLNKANKYRDYVTEFLVQWRCNYALNHLKPMEYTLPEKLSHLPL